jgi:hypothetical protein
MIQVNVKNDNTRVVKEEVMMVQLGDGDDDDDEEEVLQWQDTDDTWHNYSAEILDDAIDALQAGKNSFSFTVLRNGQHYTVDFGTKTQTNDKFGTSKPVRWVKMKRGPQQKKRRTGN